MLGMLVGGPYVGLAAWGCFFMHKLVASSDRKAWGDGGLMCSGLWEAHGLDTLGKGLAWDSLKLSVDGSQRSMG